MEPSFAPKTPQEPPDDQTLTPMTPNPHPQPPTEREFFVNVEPTCVVIFQVQKQKLFSLI